MFYYILLNFHHSVNCSSHELQFSYITYARFEVLTTALLTVLVCWYVTVSLGMNYGRFQGYRSAFILQNAGNYSPNVTATHSIRFSSFAFQYHILII
jgi:hypothetical protein